MKEKLSHAAGYLLFFVLISTSSCKKIIDEIKKNPGNGVASDCRIDKIVGTPLGVLGPGGIDIIVRDTAQFIYNAAGNPTYIKHSLYKYTLDSYHRETIFKYDSQKRLVAHLNLHDRDSLLGIDNARTWHVYKYNSDGSITVKTYWEASAPYANTGNEYESIAHEPTTHSGLQTATYTLDEYGRFKTKNSNGTTKTFNYDASGNLTGATYNNNLSYLQTHKVWMMITDNFSVNVKTAPLEFYSLDDFPTSFNLRKLPVEFSAYPTIGASPGRAESPSNDATMIYICK